MTRVSVLNDCLNNIVSSLLGGSQTNNPEQCREDRQATSPHQTLQQSHCQIPPSNAKTWYFLLLIVSAGFNWILRLHLHNVLSFNGPVE